MSAEAGWVMVATCDGERRHSFRTRAAEALNSRRRFPRAGDPLNPSIHDAGPGTWPTRVYRTYRVRAPIKCHPGQERESGAPPSRATTGQGAPRRGPMPRRARIGSRPARPIARTEEKNDLAPVWGRGAELRSERTRDDFGANQIGPVALLVEQSLVLMHWTHLPQAPVPTVAFTCPCPPLVPMMV